MLWSGTGAGWEAWRLRPQFFDQAESILMDELPIIPIYHYVRPFLIQPEVCGLYPNILGYYAYHKLYIAKTGT